VVTTTSFAIRIAAISMVFADSIIIIIMPN